MNVRTREEKKTSNRNMFECFFQMVLSEDMQSMMGVMLQMAEVITDTMNKFLPAIGQLQSYLLSIQDLNLVADNEFSQVCTLYYCTVLYPQCIHACVYVVVITQLTPSQKQGLQII